MLRRLLSRVEQSFMPLWQRLVVIASVLVVTALVARLIDRRIAGRALPAEAVTRYRVLRRSVMTAVVAVGVLSALLVVPQVRAVAGGLLASSALLGLIVGFAGQSTLANFVAGIMIAFAQPLRLGDEVEVDGVVGTVEEIGLTYTFIRTGENARLVIPNSKLASDTIRNSTIRSREKLAEITVQVPLTHDLDPIVDVLRREVAGERGGDAFVSALDSSVTVAVSAWAEDEEAADRLERDLRLRVHARLRSHGIYG